MADDYVTVRADRARYFGPEGTYESRGNGAVINNTRLRLLLPADHRHGQGRGADVAGRRPSARCPGSTRWSAATSTATTPGCARRASTRSATRAAAAAEWVKPISALDAYRRFYQLGLLASQSVAIDGIAGATPPTPATSRPPMTRRGQRRRGGADRRVRRALRVGSAPTPTASAARRRERPRDGARQPALPLDGLRALLPGPCPGPGKLNVSGASLFGVPAVLIGHTDHLAWSHTVSTAFRFTPFELRLVPGSPTTYLVDGQPKQMTSDEVTVDVRQADGSLADADANALEHRVRPGVHVDPRPAAVPLDADHGVCDGRRQRREPAPPEPLLRDRPGAVDEGALRDPSATRASRGSTRSPPTRRAGALRRHRRDPAVPNSKTARATRRSASPPTPPRAARARRLALGLQLGRGSRRRRPRHLRPGERAPPLPRRLRHQLQRQLLAVEPRAAARGLRPDHRRRAHRRAACAPGWA